MLARIVFSLKSFLREKFNLGLPPGFAADFFPQAWRRDDMDLYWSLQVKLTLLPVGIIFILLFINVHFKVWIPKGFLPSKVATTQEAILGEMTVLKNKEPGVHFGGVRIAQRGNRIIVWTAITLLDKNGKETYVEQIFPDNFTIAETYNGKTRVVKRDDKILDVTKKPRSVLAVLLIDNSGSMTDVSGVLDARSRNISKTTIAKRAANSFIDTSQADGTRIAVLPFAETMQRQIAS
jgi:hypothetical protein